MPELVIDAAPTEDDRLYQAEALVRSYCRWHIAPERAETFTLDGSGSHVMVLPTLRLTGVTTVTENGAAVDLDTVEWSEAGILRRSGCCWTGAFRGVVLDVTHGYADVPADLAGVVQAIAQRAGDNPGGLASKTTGPFSETYSTAFLDTERAVLDRYKLPSRP